MSAPVTPQAALSATTETARERHALTLAAGAVVVQLFERPALRLAGVRLDPQPALQFQSRPLTEALALHRPLLEETVMAALAGDAARQIAEPGRPAPALDEAAATLARAARDPDEAAACAAYAEVLLARTRSLLRRHWAQVQVVAAGLLEHGVLSGEDVTVRLRCVGGISNRALN